MKPNAEQKRAFRLTALGTAAGAVALMVLGLIVSVGLPVVRGEMRTDTSKARVSTKEATQGMSIYEREGCVYCHTQQVRGVSNDLGLGTVTSAEQISRDGPSLLGIARTGPDLACYGSRKEGGAAGKELSAYIADPRSVFPTSKMPRYGHLGDKELADLGSYLKSLICGGEQ